VSTFFSDLGKVIKKPSLFGPFIKSCGHKIKVSYLMWRYRNQPEKIVQLGYNQMASDYGSWTLSHERPDRGEYTQLIIDKLPKGGSVLELGCGPGDPTTRALSEHFAVTANDISKSCLELAQKAAPTATLIESDMTSLSFENDSFDGVVAFYSFHHVPRDRYQPLLNDISNWLRPGGLFVSAMYPYDIDNLVTTEGWHGSTMYWSSFDEEKTLELIRNAGLNIVSTALETAVEKDRETTFLWVVAEKPA